MSEDKKIILLVEDDSLLRDLCSRKLRGEGLEVLEATSGEQALDFLNNQKVDLILLDIILPGIDGFEVLKEIRNHSNDEVKLAPVIMLSNLGQEEDIERAMALGAKDYLVKAYFSTSEIVLKVKELLA